MDKDYLSRVVPKSLKEALKELSKTNDKEEKQAILEYINLLEKFQKYLK